MKNYLKDNKLEHIILFLSILLIITLTIGKVNNLLFLSCSICANLFLVFIIKYIKEKLNIKLDKKEKIFLLITIILIYIFYIYSILKRKFIYYWDFSCYYDMQLQSIETFQKGLLEGIRFFIGSTWSGEYGNFLSFFPQIIFQFTNKSINSYIISFVLIFIPYVFYSFALLLKVIQKYFKEEKTLFYGGIISLGIFPLLHAVLIEGQPDFFGLTFLFLIISLTLKYDFKKIEVDRLFLIFILTFMLTICRRWYIYWIISYYFIYIVNIIMINWKDKKNLFLIMKNILIYGIIVIILYLLTLFPFIKNTLLNNYSSSYSFYSNGGALTELKRQISHLGLLVFLIILGGYLYGICSNKYRRYSISFLIQYFLIILLFTKIQSIGLHHSLQLVIIYMYGIYMFMICIKNNKNSIRKISILVFSSVLIINFMVSMTNTNTILFSDIKLKIKNDENYKEIEKIYNWLNPRLSKETTAYLITHNNSINPDKLRNFKTPTSNVKKYLPYGSAVIGVHKFPLELFYAKYIMTTTPFEKISVEEKYNIVF